jgi:thymidylate synthase
MKAYLDIVNRILKEGVSKKNRTGIDTIAVPGAMFEHDMSNGFPLLTTKKVPFRLISSEIEFFIRGITDKKWLQERNNHIWDEWCSPDIVPYNNNPEIKQKMREERELGPIYGFQWRHFGAKYKSFDQSHEGIDQLNSLIEKIKKDPSDRRLIVTSWNPVDLIHMALPPCHYCFQIIVIEDRINLLWNQRSVDVALGLPFNIAGYGLLLHLIAKECKYKEGKLIGFLADTHIYVNHVEGLKEQLNRAPFTLPTIKTESFQSIFTWKFEDTIIMNYNSHPIIKFEVAV